MCLLIETGSQASDVVQGPLAKGLEDIAAKKKVGHFFSFDDTPDVTPRGIEGLSLA